MRLRSWPLVEGGPPTWRVGALAVIVATLVGTTTGSVGLTSGAVLLLALAVWRFWVPVEYELGARGILQEVLGRQQRIPWRAIGRFTVCRDGVFLARDDGPLEAFRGLYLPWGAHREDVLALVNHYLVPGERDPHTTEFELRQ